MTTTLPTIKAPLFVPECILGNSGDFSIDFTYDRLIARASAAFCRTTAEDCTKPLTKSGL